MGAFCLPPKITACSVKKSGGVLKSKIRFVSLIWVFSLVLVFQTFSFSLFAKSCATALNGISIVSINVLNLLDPTPEGGKRLDFLPGYNQDVVRDKIARIKRIVTRDGTCLPDIACVMELNNENMAHQLAAALGYEHVQMTKSPDSRGIDVALMYNTGSVLNRARFKEEIPYQADVFKQRPSRNLLLVDFDVNGKHFIVVVVHWPSMRNPIEMSMAAAAETRKAVLSQLAKFPDATVVVLGDFNSIPSKNDLTGRNPFDHEFQLGDGKGPKIINARQLADPKVLLTQPPGTYFYREEKSWNELDRAGIVQGPDIVFDPSSYLVYAHPEFSKVEPNSKGWPTPTGYFFKWEGNKLKASGASDHFPVFVQFLVTGIVSQSPPSPK